MLVELGPLLTGAGRHAALAARAEPILAALEGDPSSPTAHALRRLVDATSETPDVAPHTPDETPDTEAPWSEGPTRIAAALAAQGNSTAALRVLDELVAGVRELVPSANELASRLRLASMLGELGGIGDRQPPDRGAEASGGSSAQRLGARPGLCGACSSTGGGR